jgi:signal transduction histidine kinase
VNLSRDDLAMLLAAERRLASALSRPAELLRFYLLAVEEAASLLKVGRALLCLVDSEDPNLLRVMAGTGELADEEGELLPVEGSFEGRVYRTSTPVRTNDLRAEPEAYRPRGSQRRAGPAVAVALRVDDRPIGVLLVAREPGGAPFLERDAELLLELAAPITASIEAMRRFDAARRSREAVDAWSREQALRRWLARYEAISAARIELVFRVHADGGMEWGGSTEPLFGVPPEDYAPRIDDFIRRVDPEDAEAVQAALRSILEAGGPPGVTVDCGLLLRDGSVEQKRLRAWRLREEGEIAGVVAPIRPGETPAGGTQLGDTQSGEVSPLEARTEMIVRSLRHQINNPLAAVIGRAQLMIREDVVQNEPMLRQSVETILFEAERISRFVQQLNNVDAISRLTEPLPGEAGANEW